MSICDSCIHKNVCCDEGKGEEALTYCADFLDGSTLTLRVWIPCSKMPKEKEKVTFCDIDGDEYMGHYSNGHWWADWLEDEVKCVVAWMPNPKPYKVGDEK